MSDSNSLIDLKAIGEPLSKLVEIARDYANIYIEPKKALKNAQAGVEIAKLENSKKLIEALGAVDVDEAVALRTRERLFLTEIERQKNIDSIVSKVPEYLPDQVSQERVEEGWTASFFDSCKDVVDGELQNYWAKLLAGEIAKPGTFSLRTLSFLKTMSPAEAKEFLRICRFVCFEGVSDDATAYILFGNDIAPLNAKPNTDDNANFRCIENIGLFEKGTSFDLNTNSNKVIRFDNKVYELSIWDKTLKLKLKALTLTPVGIELFKLTDAIPDEDYISSLLEVSKVNNTYLKKVFINLCEGEMSEILRGHVLIQRRENNYEVKLASDASFQVVEPKIFRELVSDLLYVETKFVEGKPITVEQKLWVQDTIARHLEA